MKLYHVQGESFGNVYDWFLVSENKVQAKEDALRMPIFRGFSKQQIDVNEVEVDEYEIKIQKKR